MDNIHFFFNRVGEEIWIFFLFWKYFIFFFLFLFSPNFLKSYLIFKKYLWPYRDNIEVQQLQFFNYHIFRKKGLHLLEKYYVRYFLNWEVWMDLVTRCHCPQLATDAQQQDWGNIKCQKKQPNRASETEFHSCPIFPPPRTRNLANGLRSTQE